MKLVDSYGCSPLLQTEFIEDFNALDTTSVWTDTSADTGAAPSLVADGTCSGVSITTGGTDNNEAYLLTKTKWDIVANRPIVAEVRFSVQQAATNALNFFLGFGPGAADFLLDDGAGMASSFSGCGIYCTDGSLYAKTVSSVTTTRYGSHTTNTQMAGTGFQSFRMEIRPISSTEAEIVYLFDTAGGSNFVVLRDTTTGLPIKDILTYTSYAAVPFTIGVKAGSGTAEVPVVDFVGIRQRR